MEFKNRFGIPRVHEFYASEGNSGFVNIFNFDKTVGWSIWQGLGSRVFDVDEDQPIRGEDDYMNRVSTGDTGLLIAQISEKNPFDGYTDAQASEKKILRDVFEKGRRLVQFRRFGDLAKSTAIFSLAPHWRHLPLAG